MSPRTLVLASLATGSILLSTPLYAQTAETPADPVEAETAIDAVEDVVEEVTELATEAEPTEEALDATEDAAESALDAALAAVGEAVEAAATDTSSTTLQDIADADPNLELIEGEGDEPDAMVMMADVLFTFGSATLSDEALASLAGLADHLAEYPTVEIQGHTDAVGGETANAALGQARADSVREWLAANSEMPIDRIIASSHGETDPAADNENEDGSDNPEGRSLNRRVVFMFPDA